MEKESEYKRDDGEAEKGIIRLSTGAFKNLTFQKDYATKRIG